MCLSGAVDAQEQKSQVKLISDIDLKHLGQPLPLVWGRDPFIRSPGFFLGNEGEPSFTLEAIVFDRDEPLAVINGETVSEGDQIEGRKISKIGPNYVILDSKGSSIELVLPPAGTFRARKPASEAITEEAKP